MSDRTRILDHLLPIIPFEGWTEHALAEAAKRAGLTSDVFPNGVNECLDYFFAQEDAALEKAFPEEALKPMRLPQRIETLLLWRLNHLLPHREAIRRAVAQRTLPWNTPDTLQSLYRTVDLIWRLAGDASTDFSFYTKRMTLAAIYSSTLLYWLSDTSEHHAETNAFLKRRLQNVADFGKWKKECKNTLQNVFN